jgi:preprotein translocase subunit SecA
MSASSTVTKNNSMEVSVWERIGDGLSAVSEWVSSSLTVVFGSSNERFVRSLGYQRTNDADPPYRVIPGSLLARINSFEESMRALSDEELRGITAKFRERLRNGTKLDDLLPEAFAACRESARRYKNMRHFDVQMLGGVVLHQGKIAEMVTGEGKTLVATLPAYLNCLEGRGVHVVTVNDYLARRDCEWMTPIYQGLGVSAGFIQSDMDPADRRKAYDCDITYGTNSEFGFDYLRDNMKNARWGDPRYPTYQQQCQRELNYAIIDEVDNILIDEARTPLIISGMAHGDINQFLMADKIARQLKPGIHFEIKEKEHTCHMTEAGIREAEKLAGVESFYTAGNMHWPHLIDQALKAHNLYKRDKHYMVAPSQEPHEQGRPIVVIIDEFTGRAMPGRQWSDGLHQAVEAKERVPIKQETQTIATVTLQNFFKLYRKLAGMTGTAMTEANEFWKIYRLEVISIPTNRRLKRINHPDLVYRTEREKWNALLEELVTVHKTGRPILVGTVDVAKSEKLGEMLKRRGIKFELLNAKPENVARESEIVAQAGRIGAVTIATNMAGRGTDIILGGNPEYLAWAKLRHEYPTRLDVPPDVWKKTVDEIEAREKTKEEGRKVAELGGLHIIGSERHEARRIDNQLRGRSGRQGDPGSSRFYVSLNDDLMRIFGGEWVGNVLAALGMEEGQCIESRMVSRRIEAAQRKVEERNFDIRKNLLEYDEVMDLQRKRVYGFRQRILDGANPKLLILEMIDDQIDAQVDECLGELYGAETFAKFASNRLNIALEGNDFRRGIYEEAEAFAKEKAAKQAPSDIADALEENLSEEVDQRDWKWEALSTFMGAQYGVKVSVRELKQVGRAKLAEHLIQLAREAIDKVDLSEAKPAFTPEFGPMNLAQWALLKFQVTVDPKEFINRSKAEAKRLLNAKVYELYTEREIAFPAQVGVSTFMADQSAYGGQRYNREGLIAWARERFPAYAGQLNEDVFRTEPKNRLRELLVEASRKTYPVDGFQKVQDEVEKAFGRVDRLDAKAAEGLASWAAHTYRMKVDAHDLVGLNEENAKNFLLAAFDDQHRPEMHKMERSLVLNMLDQTWTEHLYVMDQLRAGIGLVSYGQIDPKSEYKKQGMKMFEEMWDAVREKTTDLVFRMEEASGSFGADLLAAGLTASQESAGSVLAQAMRTRQDEAHVSTNSGEGTKKVEPIRNRGPKVGRNDPCPCGSGKKHKQCCMKAAR